MNDALSRATYRVRRVESRLRECVAELPADPAHPIGSPELTVPVLEALGLRTSPVEVLAVIMLDSRHRAIGACIVSQGTIDSSLVHPREVFGPALRLGAASVIVAHNHPSGDSRPSIQDQAVTERLREAGKLLGVPLSDHIILPAGTDPPYSFRNAGRL